MTPFRIGTRQSQLALWQAKFIQAELTPLVNGRTVELVKIVTKGDQQQTGPMTEDGDGLFTRAIQERLRDNEVDVAVHSLKDLPTAAEAGLTLASVPNRGPVGDVMVSHKHTSFDSLPTGAKIGTGSPRRKALLLHHRSDLDIQLIRGNVDTRLRKLDEQGFDAIILAEAGLIRLGRESEITEVLSSQWMLPAVGQGALGLECRADDTDTIALLQKIRDPDTHQAVLAERHMLCQLAAGCQVPVAGHATVKDNQLTLRGVVLNLEGTERLDEQITGSADEAESLGEQLATSLKELGAEKLLAEATGQ